MNKLLVVSMLLLPAAVFAQADPAATPGVRDARAEALDKAEPVQRPDAQRVIAELSAALRLSSKQEDRISAAVRKKTADFDKLMKSYEKNSAEEKSWRTKMYQDRYEMIKINRELSDVVREFLDDEQRETFDQMAEAKRKPAPAAPAVGEAEPAAEDAAAPKPLKKKRLVKRKKVAAPAAAAAEADDAGQTMVDSEGAAPAKAAPKKKRPAAKKAAPAPAPAPEEDISEGPAGSAPTGQEAGADEDAGSYP